MQRWLAISLLCAVLAACSSVSVNVSATASTAPVTSSSYIATQSVAAALLAAGLLAAAWYGGDGVSHNVRPYPSWSIWTPPLDETRRVNEQSCTRPIEDSGANLRCR
jgi:hypothetical protein